jgi:hypothetical protein
MPNFFNFASDKRMILRVIPPDVEACILKRLGKPRLWVSNSDFCEIMERIYKKASVSAFESYYLQKSGEERDR